MNIFLMIEPCSRKPHITIFLFATGNIYRYKQCSKRSNTL